MTLSPWPRQCTQCGKDEPLPGAEVHFESMMAGRNISYTLNFTIKQKDQLEMRKCEECGMDDTSQVLQFDLDMSDICKYNASI